MMSHLLINEISILAVAALLVAAAVEDVRRLIIPNRIPLGIILLYPAYVLSAGAPVDWVGGTMVAAAALAAGFVLFALRYAGGGDVKLFVATSLWAGPSQFAVFLMVTALVGAAFALGMIAHRRFYGLPSTGATAAPDGATRTDAGSDEPAPGDGSTPAQGPKRDLPYGVAIAAGGIQVVVTILAGG